MEHGILHRTPYSGTNPVQVNRAKCGHLLIVPWPDEIIPLLVAQVGPLGHPNGSSVFQPHTNNTNTYSVNNVSIPLVYVYSYINIELPAILGETQDIWIPPSETYVVNVNVHAEPCCFMADHMPFLNGAFTNSPQLALNVDASCSSAHPDTASCLNPVSAAPGGSAIGVPDAEVTRKPPGCTGVSCTTPRSGSDPGNCIQLVVDD
jgi:hypothetical protein